MIEFNRRPSPRYPDPKPRGGADAFSDAMHSGGINHPASRHHPS